MITASELAGFIAAHAIWCVSDADSLTPCWRSRPRTGSGSLSG
ncbi:MAG TPA: hypothetical protein VH682_02845 [Gemmataceae bacterium]